MMQILVPFRNVAPWFEKCLESIRSQTHKDWACYLIDDGSTDGSDKIAKDVAKTNKKFVYCCPVKMCENGWERYRYRDWETDRKSTRLNSSHSAKSRMPSSA